MLPESSGQFLLDSCKQMFKHNLKDVLLWSKDCEGQSQPFSAVPPFVTRHKELTAIGPRLRVMSCLSIMSHSRGVFSCPGMINKFYSPFVIPWVSPLYFTPFFVVLQTICRACSTSFLFTLLPPSGSFPPVLTFFPNWVLASNTGGFDAPTQSFSTYLFLSYLYLSTVLVSP